MNAKVKSLMLNKYFGIQRIKAKPFFIYLLFFLAIFSLNLSFINVNFYLDTFRLSIWAEKGLFYVHNQQHHILVTAINSLFYSLCSGLFHEKSALIPLAYISCFFGAVGITFLSGKQGGFHYRNDMADWIKAQGGKLLSSFETLPLPWNCDERGWTINREATIPTAAQSVAFIRRVE